ncbi:MAG: hypothetical protein AUH85_13265 [Chloroflexi bacterium 13_1_40CM_4_68_4]|nr:MAG: hypothetical protein AUH85_13265 [Chloroflexi bacterium 13_1_40CM_4_68_4]
MVRSVASVVAAIAVSAVIIVGTINAYDTLADCARRQFCFSNRWYVYGETVPPPNVWLYEVAEVAGVVAVFVAGSLAPRTSAAPLFAAVLAPTLLVGGFYVYEVFWRFLFGLPCLLKC